MSNKCVHEWYYRIVDIVSWQFFCIRCGEKLSMDKFSNHASDLEKNADALNARISELEAAQRWRVVADGELPELRVGRVDLVYTVYGEIHSAMYLGNGWTSLYRDFRSNEVTHWMPLPESPNDTQTDTVVYG